MGYSLVAHTNTIMQDTASPPIRKHRMASSIDFEKEQPRIYRERAENMKASSHENLFGPAVPRSRPCVRSVQTRTRKPLPVNTLTGAVMGLVETPAPAAAPARGRRSPGGNHSQLW